MSNEINKTAQKTFTVNYTSAALQEKLLLARRQIEMAVQAVGNSGKKLQTTHARIEKTNSLLTQYVHN